MGRVAEKRHRSASPQRCRDTIAERPFLPAFRHCKQFAGRWCPRRRGKSLNQLVALGAGAPCRALPSVAGDCDDVHGGAGPDRVVYQMPVGADPQIDNRLAVLRRELGR